MQRPLVRSFGVSKDEASAFCCTRSKVIPIQVVPSIGSGDFVDTFSSAWSEGNPCARDETDLAVWMV